jgi:hypothetical protein
MRHPSDWKSGRIGHTFSADHHEIGMDLVSLPYDLLGRISSRNQGLNIHGNRPQQINGFLQNSKQYLQGHSSFPPITIDNIVKQFRPIASCAYSA